MVETLPLMTGQAKNVAGVLLTGSPLMIAKSVVDVGLKKTSEVV